MSFDSKKMRQSRATSMVIATVSSFIVGLTLAAPSASAGPNALTWSPESGQFCVDDGVEPGVSILMTTARVWTEESGLIDSSGTYSVGSPFTVNLTVPNEFFDGERFTSPGDPINGFYMLGIEFVDDCSTRQPVDLEDFTPCFVVTEPDPATLLDLGDLYLVFFFFGDVNADQSSVIQISRLTNSCDDDLNGPLPNPDPDELLDLIDELGLEFAYDLTPDPFFEFSLDPYIQRVSETTDVLPDTL